MNFYTTWAKIADNARGACLEIEDRCSPILVAMGAYPMRWFALAHGFFKSVDNDPWPRGVKLVALLFCFPCFYASDFFFKCAYLLNHRKLRRIGIKCAALGGQNGALKLDNLSLNVRDRFQLKEALCDISGELESGNSALNERYIHLASNINGEMANAAMRRGESAA